jgi:hypothetical protein
MKLHPVNHVSDKNRYCGPAVISAITGMRTGEAARLIRAMTGGTCVMGTHDFELREAFKRCGVEMRHIRTPPAGDRLTLADWLRQSHQARTAGRVFLLAAGNHWQLISCNRYVCGLTREIVDVKDPRVKRRARVTDVFELIAPGPITVPICAMKPARRPVEIDRRDSQEEVAHQMGAVEKLRAWAKERGLTYHIYTDGGLRYIKWDKCLRWKRGMETLFYDASEALDRAEHCWVNACDIDCDGYYSV